MREPSKRQGQPSFLNKPVIGILVRQVNYHSLYINDRIPGEEIDEIVHYDHSFNEVR
jgi:hypothetical protein